METVTEMVPVRGALASVAFKRSARARKISLRIDAAQGGIVITLPMRASRKAGLSLLLTHEDWVADRLAALPGALPFVAGAMVPVDGVPHEITPVPDARGGAWVEDGRIFVTGEPAFLARRVTDCLKRLARQQLATLAVAKAKQAGLSPKCVRVKDTRTRWGSCAPDGTLAFCWRLILAPDFVQDYVVGHEVAHLRHMNHGKNFWALTEALTTHRLAASAWLEANGPALLRIG
ncbi:MAG: zinc metallopeptidase [Acidocella sp. 20-57-95]|nr:MAG: zinc metallopeptidase [Acidocella sp. 20-57-95]OYV61020.1 MAG: zinc metallopeptidase [Acidocella sp. 21-58-7]HQT65091.1 SprT family zinc-dependent metalloprotease [Acidocella sp.]HQU04501.1 SprT family zinc-dependent metalloprotease [Acidocella sp.]